MARLQRTIGRPFNAEIELYSECKYTASEEVFENSIRHQYKDITNWEIVTDEDAEEIEANGLIDEHHEYLVLHFADGETATFRNSHVDMFRI